MSKSSIPRWVDLLVTPPADKPWNLTFSRIPIVSQFLDRLSSPDNRQFIVQFCQDVDKEKGKDALFKFYCKSKLSRTSLGITNNSSSHLRTKFSNMAF